MKKMAEAGEIDDNVNEGTSLIDHSKDEDESNRSFFEKMKRKTESKDKERDMEMKEMRKERRENRAHGGARPKTKTSTSTQSWDNPSYEINDVDDDKSSRLRTDVNKEINSQVKAIYPDMSQSILVGYNKDRLSVRLISSEKWRPIYKKGTNILIRHFNEELKNALGLPADDIIRISDEKNKADNTKIEELVEENSRPSITESVKNNNINEINRLKEGVSTREKNIERIRDRMSFKDGIKSIFKEYGFTVTAVIASVSVIIGVIVSNLSSGLTSMAKGVGSGLKNLGKKLGQILPGMIGAIASFIFKTAGEVISFLGKNAWLLIIAVVIFIVDQFKKKKK